MTCKEAINILNSGRQLTEQEKKELTDIYETTTEKVKVLKNYPISRISEDLVSVEGMAKKLDAECEIT